MGTLEALGDTTGLQSGHINGDDKYQGNSIMGIGADAEDDEGIVGPTALVSNDDDDRHDRQRWGEANVWEN